MYQKPFHIDNVNKIFPSRVEMSVSDVNICKYLLKNLCLINQISYAPKYYKNCHLHILAMF